MTNLKRETNRGFVMIVVLIIAGLAALKYFLNWDIFDAASSEQGQSTIGYIRDLVNTVWSYLEAPVRFAWNEVAWPILLFAWHSLQQLISMGRANA